MPYEFVLLAGDGIGPEVADATAAAVAAAGVEVHWLRMPAGAGAVASHGTPLPDETLRAIERTRVALKGPITTPVGTGFTSVNVAIRQALDLYVSLRPVRSLPGVVTRHPGVDLVIFRENTEGLYAGREHEPVPGVVETLRVITESACRRICRWASGWARAEGRRRVTLVHKATIMKQSDGLFLRAFRDVADEWPFLRHDDVLIDDCARDLVLDPAGFDCLVMENLYGDVLSDLAAGLVGGLGVVPGANIGDRYAVFEAVHGSAPDIAGQGLANPTALMQSAVLLLRHIGERAAAARLEAALLGVLAQGAVRTRDLGGSASTAGFTAAIVAALQAGPAREAA